MACLATGSNMFGLRFGCTLSVPIEVGVNDVKRLTRDIAVGVLCGVLSIPIYTAIVDGIHSVSGFGSDTWHHITSLWLWAYHDQSPRDGTIASFVVPGIIMFFMLIAGLSEWYSDRAAKKRRDLRPRSDLGWDAEDYSRSGWGPENYDANGLDMRKYPRRGRRQTR